MRVKPRDGSITVSNAYNADDATPADKKLFLNDFEMHLWARDGRQPNGLNTVKIETVVNTETVNAISSSRARLNLDAGADFTVSPTSANPVEVEVFNSLLNTPFGKNVDRLNHEYSTGKTVQSIKVVGSPANMDFILG